MNKSQIVTCTFFRSPKVNGMVSYDDPKYTKPRKALPYFPESSLLLTKDINTRSDAKGLLRREYTRTNYIADIKGSEPDSIKHSIVTTRVTNPLVPVYQSLDYGEPLPSGLIPLLPSKMIFAPTLRPSISRSGDFKDHQNTHLKLLANTCDPNQSSCRISAGELQNTSSSDANYNDRAGTSVGDNGCNNQDSSGYYESKESDETETKTAMDGVDVTLLTAQYPLKNDGEEEKPFSSSSRYKLNLEDIRGSSSRYDSQNNVRITYSNSNKDYCDNNTGRQSFRNQVSNKGGFKNSSRCGTFNRESARSKDGGSDNTMINPGKSAGDKKYQRARQEEIDSVRNL